MKARSILKGVVSFAIIFSLTVPGVYSTVFAANQTPTEKPHVVGIDKAGGIITKIEIINQTAFYTIVDGDKEHVFYLKLDKNTAAVPEKVGDIVNIIYALGTPEKYGKTVAMPVNTISVTQSSEVIGVSKDAGVIKLIETVGENYFVTITNANGESSYYITVNDTSSKMINSLKVGDAVALDYALGTPVQYRTSNAMPLSNVTVTKAAEPQKVGVSSATGVLKTIKKEKNSIFITIKTDKGLQDFYISKKDPKAKSILKLKKGSKIVVQYTLGTPIKYNKRMASPLLSVGK